MDGAISQGLCESLVHQTVLVEQREPVEAGARDRHLEVVAAAGAVLDPQLAGIGECALQELLERLGRHAAMLAVEAGHARAALVALVARDSSRSERGSTPTGLAPLAT